MSQSGRIPPRPIGPDSLLWRFAGDRRLALTGLSAGILQLMHPAIGAGVAEHSSFFDDPWARIIRSLPQILGVVYGARPEETGRRVRDYHRHIRGTDDRGRPYRALDPETFWWAHATLQNAVEQVVDRFDHRPLGRSRRESLYLDGVEWYRRYGVSMRPVPPTYSAFKVQWERVCEDVLEMTPAAEHAVQLALHPRSLEVPFLPPWTRPLHPVVVTPVLQLTAIGGLPSTVRRRFSIPWRADHRLEYLAVQMAFRGGWPWVPPDRRYGPTAAAGRQASAEREQAADAPAGVA
ncbi:MAG: oxygenase MpaB family protein [Acidimicrobiales bacterium]